MIKISKQGSLTNYNDINGSKLSDLSNIYNEDISINFSTNGCNKFSIQSIYSVADAEAKTFDSGVAEVSTLTFDSEANTSAGDYFAVYDQENSPWGIAFQKREKGDIVFEAPVQQVTDITCIAEASAKNVTEVQCVADSSDSLDKKYFYIYDSDEKIGVWIDVDDSGTQQPVDATVDRWIEVTGVATDDTADSVATAVASAIDSDGDFSASAATDTVTITDANYGSRSEAADVDSGFTISTTTSGADSNLNDKYFLIYGDSGKHLVWFNVATGGTKPTGLSEDVEHEIAVSREDDADTIGSAIETALDGHADFSASNSSGVVTVTDAKYLNRQDAADGNVGGSFDITITTQGVGDDGDFVVIVDGEGTKYGVYCDYSGSATEPSGTEYSDCDYTGEADCSAVTDAAGVATAIKSAFDTLNSGDFTSHLTLSQSSGTMTIKWLDAASISAPVVYNLDESSTDASVALCNTAYSQTTAGSSAEPTGSIWSNIPSAQKAQVSLPDGNSAIQIAALVETAFDNLTNIPFSTSDSAGDGTLVITCSTFDDNTDGVVKNSDDSGSGSISIEVTTDGTDRTIDLDTDKITISSHGYITGTKVALSGSNLPTGLSETDYYVIKVDDNTIQLASSRSNALDGTAVDITAQGGSGETFTLTPDDTCSASIQKQVSNDGSNWFDLDSSISISASGNTLIEEVDPAYKYFRLKYSVSSGVLSEVSHYIYMIKY